MFTDCFWWFDITKQMSWFVVDTVIYILLPQDCCTRLPVTPAERDASLFKISNCIGMLSHSDVRLFLCWRCKRSHPTWYTAIHLLAYLCATSKINRNTNLSYISNATVALEKVSTLEIRDRQKLNPNVKCFGRCWCEMLCWAGPPLHLLRRCLFLLPRVSAGLFEDIFIWWPCCGVYNWYCVLLSVLLDWATRLQNCLLQ